MLDQPGTQAKAVPDGSRFVVMTRGEDKLGTILAITSFLVEHGVNIEDWMVEDEEDGKVVYIAQAAVPEAADFRMIQETFRAAMAERGLTALPTTRTFPGHERDRPDQIPHRSMTLTAQPVTCNLKPRMDANKRECVCEFSAPRWQGGFPETAAGCTSTRTCVRETSNQKPVTCNP